jgi:hypothetical protein
MKIPRSLKKWPVYWIWINPPLMFYTNTLRSVPCMLLMVCLILPSGCNRAGRTKNQSLPLNNRGLVLQIEHLDDMLQENSGLVWYRNRLWTINDSGGDPVLFAIDMGSGRCIQAIFIEGAVNRDWEELAQDEDFIYILDIGNNYGRREELSIYLVPKDSIPVAGNARVRPEKISYRYGDMERNTRYFSRSPYDCEAAFAWQDSLYLFTKDWENQQTVLYCCPATPGSYTLWPVAKYPANGLVTGADISPHDSSLIILIGYKDYVPFVWELKGFDFHDYSVESTMRHDFPDQYDLQTEGIAFLTGDQIYISCEMSSWPASVYTFHLGGHAP